MTFHGGCMCGKTRFRASGPPDRVLHCHCESCRRHTGAAMATLAVFAPDQVTFWGDPRQRFESNPDVYRSFCVTCGSSLTWEATLGDEPICAIHISAFYTPEALPPTGVSFYGERIAWMDSHDTLPRFDGFVAGATPVQIGPSSDGKN